MTRAARPQQGIAVLDRMAGLAGVLARNGPASLSRLAAEAGCAPATAFRILHAMRRHGLAAQDEPRGSWRLGATWMAAGRAAQAQGALVRAAAPILAELARTTDEAVYLAVRDGQEGEVAAIHRGSTLVRLYARVGDRMPLHAGPHRLLLAHAPPGIQRAVLAGRLQRMTPLTRVDPAWIRGDMDRIRQRGWLVTTGEVAEGAASVSTAVRDAAGEVVAVLTVASPSVRMRTPRPQSLVAPLMAAAGQVRDATGWC